jgi:hypothetical protein
MKLVIWLGLLVYKERADLAFFLSSETTWDKGLIA